MPVRRYYQPKRLYTVGDRQGYPDYGDKYGDIGSRSEYSPSGHVVIYLGGDRSPPTTRQRSFSVDYGGADRHATRGHPLFKPLQRPLPVPQTHEQTQYEPVDYSSAETASIPPYHPSGAAGIYAQAAATGSGSSSARSDTLYVPRSSRAASISRYSEIEDEITPPSAYRPVPTRGVGTYDSSSPLTAAKVYNKYYSGGIPVGGSKKYTDDEPTMPVIRHKLPAGYTPYVSKYTGPHEAPEMPRSTSSSYEPKPFKTPTVDPEVEAYLHSSPKPPTLYRLHGMPGKGGLYTHVVSTGDISNALNQPYVRKSVHELPENGPALTPLEEHIRRYRHSFPKDTTLVQKMSYHPLSDTQARRLGLQPGSRALGVKVHERLIAPDENEAIRNARKFYKFRDSGDEDFKPNELDVSVELDRKRRHRLEDEWREKDEQREDAYLERQKEMNNLLRLHFDLFDRTRTTRLDTRNYGPVETTPTPRSQSASLLSQVVPEAAARSASVDRYLLDLDTKNRQSSLPPTAAGGAHVPPPSGGFRKKKPSAPGFTAKPRPKKAEVGETIRFNCAVNGNPTPKIEWFKGSDKISNDDKFYISNNFGLLSLEIRKIRKNDAGMYTIKATNEEGEAHCGVDLVVEDVQLGEAMVETICAPTFVRDVRDLSVAIGGKVIFEAQARAWPMPQFKWYKDNTQLTGDRRIQIQNNGGTTRLIIKRAQEDDAGGYFVSAENEEGKAKCAGTLRVIDKAAQMEKIAQQQVEDDIQYEYEPDTKPSHSEGGHGERPRFLQEPLDYIKVHEGDSFTLTCVVEGDPKPTVQWLKGARELNYSRRARVVSQGNRHEMEVMKTMGMDKGEYVVIAQNKNGKVRAVSTISVLPAKEEEGQQEVITQGSAQVEECSSPQFVQKLPTATTVSAGDALQIDVKVTDEKPTLKKADSAEKPSFKRKLKELILKEGEAIHLEVEVRGNPTPKVSWYRDGEQITDTSLFQTLAGQNKVALVADSATTDMSGKITAKAVNDSGEAECAANVVVQVDEPTDGTTRPGFDCELESLSLKQGDEATVEVTVTGEPTPLVSWFRDGEQIIDTSVYQFLAGAGKSALKIPSANPDMQGRYTVRATNKNGCVEIHTDISVEITDGTSRPAFVAPLKDMTVYDGDKVTLEVEISGDPTPLPTWYHEGEPIIDTSVYGFLVGEGKCQLIINNVSDDLGGSYTCRASNKNGFAECDAMLAVEPKAVVEAIVEQQAQEVQEVAPVEVEAAPVEVEAGPAPELIQTLQDQTLRPNSVAKLSIRLKGTPEAKVTWFKDGEELKDGGRNEMFVEEDSFNLEIYDLETSDSGLYSCTATNNAGSAGCECHIIVAGEEGAAGPAFKTPISDLSVKEGEAARFDCEIEGEDFQIAWTREGKKVRSGDNIKKKHKGNIYSLIIKAVDRSDEGQYEMTASTDAGSNTCAAMLHVESKKKKKKNKKEKEEKEGQEEEGKEEKEEKKKKKKDKEEGEEKKKKKSSQEAEDEAAAAGEEAIEVVVESGAAEGVTESMEQTITVGAEASAGQVITLEGEEQSFSIGASSGEQTIVIGGDETAMEQSFTIGDETTAVEPTFEESEQSFTLTL